jgi:uncharacterized DUF497 family protein
MPSRAIRLSTEQATLALVHKLRSVASVRSGPRVGEVEDARHDYGETRIKAFGVVDGLWFCCVYTMRGDVHHIVTVHRMREEEARRWLRTR